MNQQKKQIYCSSHSYNKIQFIQIKQIKIDKSIFYCRQCVADDRNFKTQNFVLVDDIVVENYKQFIGKWPLLQDNSLYKKLQKLFLKNHDEECQNIEKFFENMKQEIIKKFDEVKKSIISKALSLSSGPNEILQKYKELSKIKSFKTILLDTNTSFWQKEHSFRNFIGDICSKTKDNTQILNKLIKKYEQNQIQIEFESSEKIKSDIIELIDKINIFSLKSNINQRIINNSQNNNQENQVPNQRQQQQDYNFESQIILQNNDNFEEENQENIQFDLYQPSILQRSQHNQIQDQQEIIYFDGYNQTNFQRTHKQIDILPQTSIIKTKFNKTQQDYKIVKNQNNTISITLPYSYDYYSYANYVSDQILDENANYIFRFQFINHSKSSKNISIGLIRDSQKDIQYGYNDKLSCFFQIHQNNFYKSGDGIDKKVIGDFSVLSCQDIEMRVCIKDGKLWILDYPNYNHILSLEDQYQRNLREFEDLRLYIGLFHSNMQILLTHASKQN